MYIVHIASTVVHKYNTRPPANKIPPSPYLIPLHADMKIGSRSKYLTNMLFNIIYSFTRYLPSTTFISVFNIYFRLRFGLANAINTYLRLKVRVVLRGIFNLK